MCTLALHCVHVILCKQDIFHLPEMLNLTRMTDKQTKVTVKHDEYSDELTGKAQVALCER